MDPAPVMESPGTVDPRLDTFRDLALKLLGSGADKWQRMLSQPACRADIVTFFDSGNEPVLLLIDSGSSDLVACLPRNRPKNAKQAALYFLKSGAIKILTAADMHSLSFGRLNLQSVETFHAVLEEIYQPILFDAKVAGLPANVAQDFQRSLQGAILASQSLAGTRKGMPILNLPSKADQLVAAATSSDEAGSILVLEATAAEWTRQIKLVLSDTPDAIVAEWEAIVMDDPAPKWELQFWEGHLQRLESLHLQLQTPQIGACLAAFESLRHPVGKALLALKQDVDEATTNARDVFLHLKPLAEPMDQLISPLDFESLAGLWAQLLPMISLVVNHCAYFASHQNVIRLLEQVIALYLYQAHAHLQAEAVLSEEPSEVLKRISTIKRTTQALQVSMISTIRLWKTLDLDFSELLNAIRGFETQILELEGLIQSMADYLRLDKVDLGGVWGLAIQSDVDEIASEFKGAVSILTQESKDVVKDRSFLSDLTEFNRVIEGLDHRMGVIGAQALGQSSDVLTRTKMLQVLGPFASRTVVAAELRDQALALVVEWERELQAISEAIKSLQQPMNDFNHWNVPMTAGQFQAAISLHKYLDVVAEHLGIATSAWSGSLGARAKESLSFKKTISDRLASHMETLQSHWSKTLVEKASQNLRIPFLVRSADKHLSVNFDERVRELLRDVRHLQSWEVPVPPKAKVIFSQMSSFQARVQNLQETTLLYNTTLNKLMPIEEALLGSRIRSVDGLIETSMRTLTWESAQADQKIQEIGVAVQDLAQMTDNAKSIWARMEQITAAWTAESWVVRPSLTGPLNFETADDMLMKLGERIRADGKQIHSVMESLRTSLTVDTLTEKWFNYRKAVDAMVQEALHSGLRKTLTLFVDAIKPSGKPDGAAVPLVEVTLDLRSDEDGPILCFSPSLIAEDDDSLKIKITRLLDDVFTIPSEVERIAPHPYAPGLHTIPTVQIAEKGEPLQVELSDADIQSYRAECVLSPELQTMREEIVQHLKKALSGAESCQGDFEPFDFLWVSPVQGVDRQSGGSDRPVQDASNDSPVRQDPDKSTRYTWPAVNLAAAETGTQLHELDSIVGLLDSLPEQRLLDDWFRVDCQPVKGKLVSLVRSRKGAMAEDMVRQVTESVAMLSQFIQSAQNHLQSDVYDDRAVLVDTKALLDSIAQHEKDFYTSIEGCRKLIQVLEESGFGVASETLQFIMTMPSKWVGLMDQAETAKTKIGPLQNAMAEELRNSCAVLEAEIRDYRATFKGNAPYGYAIGDEIALNDLAKEREKLDNMMLRAQQMIDTASLFGVSSSAIKQISELRRECDLLGAIWQFAQRVRQQFQEWRICRWDQVQTDVLESTCQDYMKEMRKMDRDVKSWNVFAGLDRDIKDMITQLQVAVELRSPNIRERHWNQLLENSSAKINQTSSSTLQEIISLGLDLETVRSVADRAAKEVQVEKHLDSIRKTWEGAEFTVKPSATLGPDALVLAGTDILLENLEDNQVLLQNMLANKHVQFFQPQIAKWQEILGNMDSTLHLLLDVQQSWSHLVSIFMGSEDIKTQLPEDAAQFARVDATFQEILRGLKLEPRCLSFCAIPGIAKRLEDACLILNMCERSLSQYLDKKRQVFPRFYFVSRADLLDILSKGNVPTAVCKHLPKLFDSVAQLKFAVDASGMATKTAIGMFSKEDEYVPFSEPLECVGPVEHWLNRLVEMMRRTLHQLLGEAVTTYQEKPREQWLFDYPAQIVLAATQIWWNTEVNLAFAKLEEGFENAMKDYHRKQCNQITGLIQLIQGNLTPLDRTKIMTLCTLDVHARDVITKLVAEKADSSQCFSWLSQLRLMWDDEKGDCFANIADASFRYSYEYLGCTPRLVVTPLTDRCYITLTQALHLYMGGAPAGPAGTGKTETTKDLGRALGCMVYVFNCSEQMDYKSIGNIYRGLVQEGAWGCFDEFNRIPVDVLSVIGTQVKSIQDALRAKKTTFFLEGEETRLNPNVGIFITMNPGYAGRTELPENIKALFRPCSMVVPDLQLICEIMLMAEGFVEATVLAQKFTTLYKLCRELLSQQDHYDWGLRAIKSVLVVAGGLKRADPDMPESHILMRSLRDFNVPKIVTGDLPIFLGLIHDLFPSVEVARKKAPTLEDAIRKAATDAGLQAEDNFVLKAVQLDELMAVRHSVFIIGPPGSGKTQVWKTLSRAKGLLGKKCLIADLDPKAVSTDELYGCIHPTTREWKDGLFSSLLRDMAAANADVKWLVLDGDIDPNWIESLNTVMDDNKVLTLASNERIPLQPNMRLIFEICDLKNATPATVSRAGILYLNANDIGWGPLLQTWLDGCGDIGERSILSGCFEKHMQPCIDYVQSSKAKAIQVESVNLVSTTCDILRSLLVAAKIPKGSEKEIYEIYFCFALIWGCGGIFASNGDVDGRVEFSNWWHASSLKQVSSIPQTGLVFDYFVDHATRSWKPWSSIVPASPQEPETPFSSLFVHTAETFALSSMMDLLLGAGKSILLVGNAGCGKTLAARAKLAECTESAKYDGMMINLTYYTNGVTLQQQLEKPLEKKAGRTFGPKGSAKFLYFLDDLNMPEVDKYGTVECHALLRQHLDHGHWYDRNKLSLKDINNCGYIACLNPKVGSFGITQRLQRHFATFAVPKPAVENLHRIYTDALKLRLPQLSPEVTAAVNNVVDATLAIQAKAHKAFQATAAKPHYLFNLHDLAGVFQGICLAGKEALKTASDMARLWAHESARIYADKLATLEDTATFQKHLLETISTHFNGLDASSIMANPAVFGWNLKGAVQTYGPAASWDQLKSTLQEFQDQYNESHAAQNLILFEDAISHAFRISRILRMPEQHALLVGVGGSGKQSLARLSAFMAGMEAFQITPGPNYNVAEMRNDLAALFIKAGQKKQQIALVLPDGHVTYERLLIPINEFLCTGEISGLYPDDVVDSIVSAMRGEAKSLGLGDSKKVCMDLFYRNVGANCKIVMCFSPIGPKLKLRLQRFPGILSRTKIDWFHEWPITALVTVAEGLLESCEHLPRGIVGAAADFMGNVHIGIGEVSKELAQQEQRRVFTTPKSFLSYVQLYKKMLAARKAMVVSNMERLAKGLQKLQTTGEQVDELKIKLAQQDIELTLKNEVAEKLIQKVAMDTEKVNSQKLIADEEERKVNQITQDVSERQAQCENDLKAAEPALAAAAKALNTLNKANLTELKSFGSPTVDIINVVAAVMVLLSPPGKIAKDRSWKAGKNMMAKVDQFLDSLVTFKKEAIDQSNLDAVQAYLSDPNFNEEYIGTKSIAAAGLCSWVINIVQYYKVFREVEPKRLALEAANAELRSSQAKLAAVQAHVAELDANLLALKQQFEQATQEKLECTRAAKETADTISLANRLVVGLASEKTRWGQEYARHEEELKTLPADVLVAASFVAYAGPFPKRYREHLITKWTDALRHAESKDNTNLKLSESFTLSGLLMTSMEQAVWNNEGLPTDQTSLENAVIITRATRWPLIVDPQLQAVNWIKSRDPNLQVTQMTQPGFMNSLANGISSGATVLIEDVGEWIDPTLEPLLSQSTIRGGRFIKVGDKEIEYDSRFRLILQTRLSNPNYPPEIQAQTTLVNFSVTIDGLEDQLLADVVRNERPDLEESKRGLTKSQNEFKVKLLELENSLLEKLSAAQGDFLKDTTLVESLENTKATASTIEIQVKEALATEKTINAARESYRPVARRSAQIYFLLNDLWKINPMYQYSLFSFKRVFLRALNLAQGTTDLEERIRRLLETITQLVFTSTNRGLFERDKLTMVTQLSFLVHTAKTGAQTAGTQDSQDAAIAALPQDEIDFVLQGPPPLDTAQGNVPKAPAGMEWLSDVALAAVKHLSQKEAFRTLANDIENSSKQWRKYCELEAPELEKMPQDWKNKTALQKLCVLRCLRPDRMINAVRQFVSQLMGPSFVDQPHQPLASILQHELDQTTPIFFILSPGVDPLKDVEAAGRQLGFSQDAGTLSVVSLGQGQEARAEQCLIDASKRGTWVMLQNIHLVAKWLPKLAATLERICAEADDKFRIFLSAEPAADPEFHIIPSSLLQRSIKITNEPPTGMNANLHRALDSFEPGTMERSSKDAEYRALMFALFFFHAVVLERRKFGVQGWNKPYPFTTGDLTISGEVLYNYLENYSRIPWIDLRYIIGDIMYGGHISDYWDRRLCTTYLETFMPDEQMFERSFELAPNFSLPAGQLETKDYHSYIDAQLPPEAPTLYKMHANAEIEVLTKLSDYLFRSLVTGQQGPSRAAALGAIGEDDRLLGAVEEMLERLPEPFNLVELYHKAEERTPFTNVALQECELMNKLLVEMSKLLKELVQGLKGSLTLSPAMEANLRSIIANEVPKVWTKYSYPSQHSLAVWFTDMLQRVKQLEAWVAEFQVPHSLWLGGLFSPQSFLTAIMQTTARKLDMPIDKLALSVEVTKKSKDEITNPPRDGAYVHGLRIEGARWDTTSGSLQDAILKDLRPFIPVLHIKAVPADRKDVRGTYECPLYRTRIRGPTFVCPVLLKTKDKPSKWTLTGTALFLE